MKRDPITIAIGIIIVLVGIFLFQQTQSKNSSSTSNNGIVQTEEFVLTPLNNNTEYSISLNKNNSTITEIVIPNFYNNKPITVIDNNGFENCTSLKKITFGNNLNKIGSSAFKGCSNLTTINFSNSIKIILESAFENCSSLTNIEIADGLETIETKVFKGCEKLKIAYIPETVSFLGEQCFSLCNKLEVLYLPFAYATTLEVSDYEQHLAFLFGGSLKTDSHYSILDCVPTSLELVLIHNGGDYSGFNTNELYEIEVSAFVKKGATLEEGIFNGWLSFIYFEGNIYDWQEMNETDSIDKRFLLFYEEEELITEGNFWRYIEHNYPVITSRTIN